MKPPKKPKVDFTPMYSANLLTGYAFMHYALQAVGIAFLAGGK